MANTIDSGIDIGYFGGIDIDIGIDKRPLQLLVLILVLIRGLPQLLAILFIYENTVITASKAVYFSQCSSSARTSFVVKNPPWSHTASFPLQNSILVLIKLLILTFSAVLILVLILIRGLANY